MTPGFISQIISLLIYSAVFLTTSKAVYRLFTRFPPTRFFDPLKVSLWFVALSLLYNFWVRFNSSLPTLLTIGKNLEWPLSSLLVSTTIGGLCVVLFRTEKAIYDAGEP